MPELDFRDGKRGVPEHVASLLTNVPTYKMTYDEAMAEINRRLQYNYVEKIHGAIISESLKGGR